MEQGLAHKYGGGESQTIKHKYAGVLSNIKQKKGKKRNKSCKK